MRILWTSWGRRRSAAARSLVHARGGKVNRDARGAPHLDRAVDHVLYAASTNNSIAEMSVVGSTRISSAQWVVIRRAASMSMYAPRLAGGDVPGSANGPGPYLVNTGVFRRRDANQR